MANSGFQALYMKKESTFGAGTGDFSGADGLRVMANEKVGLDAFKQKMQETNFIIGTSTELGPMPAVTLKEGSFTLSHVLSGATRNALAITEDNTSKMLQNLAGTRGTPVDKDDVAALSDADTIIIAGSETYVAGDLIMVNNEVRRVEAWTVGTKTIDLNLPLSAAPTAGDDVLGVEVFDLSAAANSFALGVETSLSSADVLAKGCFCKKFSLGTINNTEQVTFSAECQAQDFDIDSGLVTVASTNGTLTAPVMADGAGGLALLDATGALWKPILRSAEPGNAFEQQAIPGVGATNGIAGFEKVVSDEQLTSLKCSIYADATAYAKLQALVGVETEVCLQVGKDAGKIVGLYFQRASVFVHPEHTDQDKMYFIDFTLKGSGVKLFRA